MFVPISYFHIFRQSLKTLRHIYFTRATVIQLRHFPKIKKAAARTASIIGLCPSSILKRNKPSYHFLPLGQPGFTLCLHILFSHAKILTLLFLRFRSLTGMNVLWVKPSLYIYTYFVFPLPLRIIFKLFCGLFTHIPAVSFHLPLTDSFAV